MVAVDAVIIEVLSCNNALIRYRTQRAVDCAMSSSFVATRNHWAGVVAVVDDGGWPILIERMDHAAYLATVELAPGKARTAALSRSRARRSRKRSTTAASRPLPRRALSRCKAGSRLSPAAK